jgi:hypothetical protein
VTIPGLKNLINSTDLPRDKIHDYDDLSEDGKRVKKVEREIRSSEVAVGATVSTFAIWKEIRGEFIDDIIVHDGVFKLFNRKDELLNEINFPVLRVNYGYVGGGGLKECF